MLHTKGRLTLARHMSAYVTSTPGISTRRQATRSGSQDPTIMRPKLGPEGSQTHKRQGQSVQSFDRIHLRCKLITQFTLSRCMRLQLRIWSQNHCKLMQDIFGRSVSLLEGLGDDKTLVIETEDGSIKLEDMTADNLERTIQTLPRVFQGHFASPESVAAMPCNITGMDSDGIAAAVAAVMTQDRPAGSSINVMWGLDSDLQNVSIAHITKMNLPMLAHSVKTLVQGKEPAVALKVVDFALQTRPNNVLLQSWRQTLFDATANVQQDMEAIISALQPYVPDTPAAIADCARVRFYVGDHPLTLARPCIGPPSITGLLELSKVLDLNPGDAQNLATLAYMKMRYTNNLLGGLRLFQHADQMRPVQDFHVLKWVAEHCSNIDTTWSVSIFDRMLQMQPHTYPARLAYARVFQQRGACKSTLGQDPEALADLQMAVKLGRDDAATYKYLGNVYYSMGNKTAALSAFDSAHCETPEDADALLSRGALTREMGNSLGAVADFDLAEALEPLPEGVALARQLMLDM